MLSCKACLELALHEVVEEALDGRILVEDVDEAEAVDVKGAEDALVDQGGKLADFQLGPGLGQEGRRREIQGDGSRRGRQMGRRHDDGYAR